MRFFGLKTCDTCRKARRSLADAGVTVDVIDVRKDGIPPSDIAAIIAVFGDKAINRASTTWRGLDDNEKQADPVQLLTAYPTLMKRPVIEANGTWTLGWKPDVQAKHLGG